VAGVVLVNPEVDPSSGVPDRVEGRRIAGPALATAGGLIVVVASFLPWLRTGTVNRSSYAVVRSAELLDLVSGPVAVGLKLWYLVPALAAGVWLAAVVHRRALVVGLGSALGLVALVVAGVVIWAPLRTGGGPVICLGGVAVLAVGLILTVGDRRGVS
jgi:hypothetical protein